MEDIKRKENSPRRRELEPPVPHYTQSTKDYACGPVCNCMAVDYLLTRKGKPRLDHAGVEAIERLTMDSPWIESSIEISSA